MSGNQIAVIAIVLALTLLVAWSLQKRKARVPAGDLGARLRTLLSDGRDYKVFIGLPVSSPVRWAQVEQATETGLVVAGTPEVRFSQVTAAVVAYPNGQVLLAEMGTLDYPAGITGLEPASSRQSDLIQLQDLHEGADYMQVEYGPSQLKPGNRNHYSTTLRNISEKKIRVVRFGGYLKSDKGYELYNATGAFYSAEEFRNWYGMVGSEWIMPGQTVQDPNNYGPRPVIWAYYCITEDGKELLAGELLE